MARRNIRSLTYILHQHYYHIYLVFEAIRMNLLVTMSSGTLHIVDSRTSAKYQIPIKRNAVSALDLKRIRGPKDGADRADHVTGGLRVHDPGLQNTAVVETAISFSYGVLHGFRGWLTAAGTTIGESCSFEDTAWNSCGTATLRTCSISSCGGRIPLGQPAKAFVVNWRNKCDLCRLRCKGP